LILAGIEHHPTDTKFSGRQYYSVGRMKAASLHKCFGADSGVLIANPDGKGIKYWSFAIFGTFSVFGANLVRKKMYIT
jgi:hypothetical protein